MAAYRKIPATGNVDLDRINQAVYEALTAIAPPDGFQAVTVAKDYAARGDEGVIHVDASAGPVRVTLPKPSNTLPPLVVKQVNNSASPRATFGAVTVVAANNAKAIAGQSSFALDSTGTGSVTFTSDGQQHWPGAAAGGNPSVTPTPPPPPPYVPPVSATFVPLTRVINTVSPLSGGGALSSDLTIALNIDGTLAVTGGNLGLSTTGVTPGPYTNANITVDANGRITSAASGSAGTGTVTVVTATAPLFITSTPTTTPNVTIQGAVTTGGTSTSPTNLGALGNGVLEQSVSLGVSAPAVFFATLNRVTLGGGGGLTDSANLMFNGSKLSLGQSTFDGTAHVVLTDDTTPGTIAAWDGRHFAFGASGSTGAGIGISHTVSTSTGNVSFVLPNSAWENARFQALTFGLYSSASTLGLFQDSGGNVYDSVLTSNGLMKTIGGNGQHATAVAGTDYQGVITWPAANDVLVSAGPGTPPVGDSSFTFDATAHTHAAGNGVSINGATLFSNTSFVTGITTNTNRDRCQFNVGGGALGATGTGDNTLVDVIPSSTTIRTGVTAGIYATQRIRAVTYASPGPAVTLSEAATLYIDGPPSIGGGITTTGPWALHVAAGGTRLAGARVDTLSAGGIVAADPAALGTLGIAGVGGLPGAISATLPYYINTAGSNLNTGFSNWFATSSTASQGTTALEYNANFAAVNVSLTLRIITNAVTSGTLSMHITRNGATFTTINITSSSSGTITTGSLAVGSPVLGDRWGLEADGFPTVAGNMVFTATLELSPNVF